MAKDDRLWAPFRIEMDEHPKIIGLTDAAFRAVFEATFYSRRMQSDGFLDERVVLKRWGQSVADELSCNDPDKPSWVRVDQGWQIYNFGKYHPLRAEIEEKRALVAERRSRAGKNGAAKRWDNNGVANEWQSDSKSDGKAIASDSSETETETETTTSNEVVKTHVAKAATLGTRLPEPFMVNRGMREWAAEKVPGLDVDAATESFVDYWRGRAGASARKVDWPATWRNSLRSAHSRAGLNHPARKPMAKADQNAAEYQRIYGGGNGRAGSIPAIDSGISA